MSEALRHLRAFLFPPSIHRQKVDVSNRIRALHGLPPLR